MNENDDVHAATPDVWTQIRQWVGLMLALGGLLGLLNAGRQMGVIETHVLANGAATTEVGKALAKHLDRSNEVFRDVSRVASGLDSRLSRLEGIDEARER